MVRRRLVYQCQQAKVRRIKVVQRAEEEQFRINSCALIRNTSGNAPASGPALRSESAVLRDRKAPNQELAAALIRDRPLHEIQEFGCIGRTGFVGGISERFSGVLSAPRAKYMINELSERRLRNRRERHGKSRRVWATRADANGSESNDRALGDLAQFFSIHGHRLVAV